MIPELVAPNQYSFAPGHHITDNIVMAQEMIHSMSSMKGKKSFIAIKVDLEQAYVRLS